MNADGPEPESLGTLKGADDADSTVWELRLYVAGKTARSVACERSCRQIGISVDRMPSSQADEAAVSSGN